LDSYWPEKIDKEWNELGRVVDQRLRTNDDSERMFDLLKELEPLANEVRRKSLEKYHMFIGQARKLLAREGPDHDHGAHWKAIRANVRPFATSVKDKLNSEVIGCLCDPINRGVKMAEVLIQTCERTLAVLERSLEGKSELLGTEKMESAHIERPDEIVEAQLRYDSARAIPRFLWPYHQTAVKTTRQDFEQVVIGFFGKVRKQFKRLLDETKDALRHDLYVLYRDSVLEAAGKARFIQDMAAHVGEKPQQRTAPDGTKTMISSGLFKEVTSYAETMAVMGRRFNSYYNATQKERNDERNVFLERRPDFDGLVLRHVAAKWDMDQQEKRALMKRAMRQFFIRTHWLSEAAARRAQESAFDDEIPEVYKEGMEAIYSRAAKAQVERGEWNQVRKELDAFTFQLFEGFMAEESASKVLGQGGEAERISTVVDLMRRARPWARLADEHKEIERGFMQRLNAATAGDDPELADIILKRAGAEFEGVDLLSHQLGSLIAYSEVVATPIIKFASLRSYRDAYRKNIEQDPVFNRIKRHSEKNAAKFRDILPPVGEAWTRRRKVLGEMTRSIALRVLNYTPGSGFFYNKLVGFEEEPTRVGLSIDEMVERLSEPGEAKTLADISKKNREAFEQLQNKGDLQLFQLVSLLRHYLKEVYPLGESEDDTQPNMRRRVVQEWLEELFRGPVRNFVPQQPAENEKEYGQRVLREHVLNLHPEHTSTGYEDHATRAELMALKPVQTDARF
jgi:hypothetical protein